MLIVCFFTEEAELAVDQKIWKMKNQEMQPPDIARALALESRGHVGTLDHNAERTRVSKSLTAKVYFDAWYKKYAGELFWPLWQIIQSTDHSV